MFVPKKDNASLQKECLYAIKYQDKNKLYAKIVFNSLSYFMLHFHSLLHTFSAFSLLVLNKLLTLQSFMETIEVLISSVLEDIRQKGYSRIQPFVVGNVEERMRLFAQVNDITLGGDELYMSAKQLQHCLRASKGVKGLVVDDADLISFPKNRFQMELYYDGECFIYTDGHSKFIIHPNYKMKISREIVKRVNFITATRQTDKKEFNGKRYIKLETDSTTK